jgi:ATP-dependent Clp protease ATP-binding subunit ClpC
MADEATPGTAGPSRWSAAARDALDRARDEAQRLGHDYVGTEHALLALASAQHGAAAEILAQLGVSRERILATSCMQPPPHQARGPMRLMPRFKQALEHTRRIADGLGVPVADTEHLLAGVVAVPDSMAVEILRRLRVSPDKVRGAVGDRLGVDPQRLGAPHRGRRRLLATWRSGRRP